MMIDPIDRYALLKAVYDNPPEKARMTQAEWCRKCIYEAPTLKEIDLSRYESDQKVAQWIPYGRDTSYNSYIRCSNCNHEVVMYADSEKIPPKFCENCGFVMK